MTKAKSGRIAPRKDLHDGRSVWADSSTRPVKLSKFRQSQKFEIVVVGAGISGAITALTLSSAGHEVAIVDRRMPGQGSTVASTAMIQFEIDTPLIKLADKIGKANATRAYLRSADAVRDLGHLIEQHRLDAKWLERDALYLAGNEMGFRGLEAETAARRKIGLQSRYLTKQEVLDQFEIESTGAILSKGSAELDPARMSASCLNAAEKVGAVVFAPCEVVAVKSDGGLVQLSLKGGGILECRKAIFATGYEVIGGLPRDAFDIVSSWAIATKPISPASFWPTRCLIWEAADPYLYMRTTFDNRIIAGGEDSGLIDAVRRAAAIPSKSAKLMHKVAKLLGRADLTIDYAWAGAFADSPTGLPVFKELPDLPGVFVILGCGGNGITFSVIASQVVKAWVRGRTDKDAELFTGR